MLTSAEPVLLRRVSNLAEAGFVGVGGVLTMTGVPLSDAVGGVPGGVLVSMRDGGLERRRKRWVGPWFCSLVSVTASFVSDSDSVVESRVRGSSKIVCFRSLVDSAVGFEPAVAGRLSGLLDGLLPPPDLEKLVLDLRRPLIRPTGEGERLLEREVGGTRLAEFSDPEGSASPAM